MSDQSNRLALPYLQPSQAQKHVTVNEALQRLDLVTQMTIAQFGSLAPPTTPAAGECHALGDTPVDAWDGHAAQIAMWNGSAWVFATPLEGWLAWDLSAGVLRRFATATGWEIHQPETQNLALVGINTTADTTNRLALAADASLFSHDGGGHQLKINKAGATDTASVLFQSGWTGHAEMGLAGNTSWSIKVSADGGTWHQALTIDPAAETVSAAPAGVTRMVLGDAALQLDVPMTGTAVQASASDATVGRLMTVGAFGLGASTPVQADDIDTALASGLYRVLPAYAGTGALPAALSGTACLLRVESYASDTVVQTLFRATAATAGIWRRIRATGSWGAWMQSAPSALVGTVAQSAGTPTGALIERGSNANGEYVRFADGTQICWKDGLIDQSLSANTYLEASWTFPAAFVSGGVSALRATARSTNSAAGREAAARYLRGVADTINTTSAQFGVVNTGTAAMTAKLDAFATGRWF